MYFIYKKSKKFLDLNKFVEVIRVTESNRTEVGQIFRMFFNSLKNSFALRAPITLLIARGQVNASAMS